MPRYSKRVDELIDRIESDPDVMLGKPVIAGTRITVELILDALAEGESVAEILESYPRIVEQDIRAAIAFAAAAVRSERIYPLTHAS
jgi:uncharacterized protein (DUF433 family)